MEVPLFTQSYTHWQAHNLWATYWLASQFRAGQASPGHHSAAWAVQGENTTLKMLYQCGQKGKTTWLLTLSLLSIWLVSPGQNSLELIRVGIICLLPFAISAHRWPSGNELRSVTAAGCFRPFYCCRCCYCCCCGCCSVAVGDNCCCMQLLQFYGHRQSEWGQLFFG